VRHAGDCPGGRPGRSCTCGLADLIATTLVTVKNSNAVGVLDLCGDVEDAALFRYIARRAITGAPVDLRPWWQGGVRSVEEVRDMVRRDMGVLPIADVDA
jgi:hypothetical protein